jgi:hypothetical protein
MYRRIEMTENEKLIWAAAYVLHLKDSPYTPQLATLAACRTVETFRFSTTYNEVSNSYADMIKSMWGVR